MSDDWRPGDLALCVDARPRNGGSRYLAQLREGAVYEVVSVVAPALWDTGAFEEGLELAGVHNLLPTNDWPASRFRKINPLTNEEADEFVRDLIVPVKVRA